jgi:hypothetical protein
MFFILIFKAQEALKALTSNTFSRTRDQLNADTRLANEGKFVRAQNSINNGIRLNLRQDELVRSIKAGAVGVNIHFGSILSAVYHMRIHPVDPMKDYIKQANVVVKDGAMDKFSKSADGSIDVCFTRNRSKVCVFVKEKFLLLKTFIPKVFVNLRYKRVVLMIC